ncbi:MAG: Tetratricopeptide repeat protein [Methanoregula sp. PtaU1.Bin051]|nr:MAG: Tetratricopeptide repeat protein [Methanoregula sp. PtaU1.Bin051]
MISYKYMVAAALLLCISCSIVSAADDAFNAAGALYTKSVDLANEGRYGEALAAAEQALAFNVSAINHLVQANRAGILVMLGRYEEAVAAADSALAVEGNLTATHAAAYYNKGDALRHLGMVEEAREAFARAHELDSSLPIPEITPTPTKAPFPLWIAVVACALGGFLCTRLRKKPDQPD